MELENNKNSRRWLAPLIFALVIAVIAAWCVFNAIQGGGVTDAIKLSTTSALLVGLFLITLLGYLLGSVSIKGVSLGTAGVFLVAILFGYLSTLPALKEIPVLNAFSISESVFLNDYYKTVISNVGLVLFVASVGFIAGPNFFKNLKKNATSFVALGVVIILGGGLVAVLFALIPGIGPEFSAGVLAGALTSTPGFSAAKDVAASPDLVTLGYAIAYPFGVLGVVLFVQLIPKILRADIDKERALLNADKTEEKKEEKQSGKLFEIEPLGLAPLGLAVVVGLIVGAIKIPLSGAGYAGPCFSLGTTGGVLVAALVCGHFGRIGRVSIMMPTKAAKIFRELGLVLFLAGAGFSGGVSLVSEIGKSELGPMIVVYGLAAGVVMTLAPMLIGFLFAKYVLKLSLFNNLGSITGGMTSTPALGTLINTAKTDDVAGAYASTYPIALVLIVLVSQLMITLMA